MSATIEHIVLHAPDISCGHCVKAIRDEVGSLAGVVSVDPSEQTKQVAVAYDPSEVSLAAIKEAMDEAGYPVSE